MKAHYNSMGFTDYPLDCWDDGFQGDQVWIIWDSMGPCGVVRASTLDSAYESAVDEILRDAPDDDPEIWSIPGDAESGLAEGYIWRSSGVPSNPGLSSAIASEDLNGWGITPIEDWNRRASEQGSWFVTVELDEEEEE